MFHNNNTTDFHPVTDGSGLNDEIYRKLHTNRGQGAYNKVILILVIFVVFIYFY